MEWFRDCKTLAEAKKKRADLAKIHHPDHGGSVSLMQEINRQFDAFVPHTTDWPKSEFTQGNSHQKNGAFSGFSNSGGFTYSYNSFDFAELLGLRNKVKQLTDECNHYRLKCSHLEDAQRFLMEDISKLRSDNKELARLLTEIQTKHNAIKSERPISLWQHVKHYLKVSGWI